MKRAARPRPGRRPRQAHRLGDVLAYRRLLDEHGPTDWQAYDELQPSRRVLGLVAERRRRRGRRSPAPGEITASCWTARRSTPSPAARTPTPAILTWDGGRAEVLDVQRPVKGLVVHQVRVLEGELRRGRRARPPRSTASGGCGAARRTRAPTSCTRRCARCSARRRCSPARTTGPGYLRLDFAWQGALSAAAAHRHRGRRQRRRPRRPRRSARSYMTLPEAREFGALALFGETYGEQVRVVEIGGPWSRELCGGTHVARQRPDRHAGAHRRVARSAPASRRVEAAVGIEGFRYLARERDLVRQLADLLKAPQDGLVERVSGMLARLRDADKELAELRGQQTLAAAGDLAASAHGRAAASPWSPARRPGWPAATCAAWRSTSAAGSGDQPGGGPAGVGSPTARCRSSPRSTRPRSERGLSANDLLKAAAGPVGGRGGGKADVAQGGGTDPAGIPAALAAGEQAIAAATGVSTVSDGRERRAARAAPVRSGGPAPRAAGRPAQARPPAAPPTAAAPPTYHPTDASSTSPWLPAGAARDRPRSTSAAAGPRT